MDAIDDYVLPGMEDAKQPAALGEGIAGIQPCIKKEEPTGESTPPVKASRLLGLVGRFAYIVLDLACIFFNFAFNFLRLIAGNFSHQLFGSSLNFMLHSLGSVLVHV